MEHTLSDQRSVAALATTKRYAPGDASAAELAVARAAAWAAAHAIRGRLFART